MEEKRGESLASRGEQKTRKPIKPRKLEKKTEKTEPKKKPIKPINFLKKPAGSVRFRFYKQKTEPNQNRQKTEKKPSQTEPKPSQTGKIEPNRKNRAKTEKTKPNRFEPVFALKKPNRTETGRFDPVSVRFRFFFKKKIRFGYFF